VRGTEVTQGSRTSQSYIVESYWRDEESLARASALHAAIDEAPDLLRVKTTANVYDIIQDL
jgi:hypothetical protein